MSTQVNLYVMLCAPIPEVPEDEYTKYDDAGMFDSAYDKKPEGLFVLYDGMCGKYCYAGYAYVKSVDLVGHGYELLGIPNQVAEIPDVLEKVRLQKDIKDKLGIEVDQKDIAVRVLLHYR